MQLKSLVRFPVDIRRARRQLDAPKAPLDSFDHRPIVLDLVTPHLLIDVGRHFASLAHDSRTIGSPFYVRCSPFLLACIARKMHGREMLAEPQSHWIGRDQPLPDQAFVLSDAELDSSPDGVQMMIGRDVAAGEPVMPYPMHPWTLPHSNHHSLQEHRRPRPRQLLFFAGNQKRKYGDPKMQRQFGVLSRLQVLDVIRKHFPERVVTSPQQSAGSPGVEGSTGAHPPRFDRAIVLTDSRSVSIPASGWLGVLAGAQFFVCCPGASQPTCHNLVEAMSVGTIPLIEYSDRVIPNLVDGVNAITFRGEAGLVEAIQRIDSLETGQIEAMRRNVAEFYDQHLCGSSFLAGLRDGRVHCPKARVFMPFHDRNLFPETSLSQLSAAA